jgi:sRNA-binding protein
MRRIVLVLVLVVVLAVAGYMLFRPKRAPARAKARSALTDSSDYGGARPASAVRPAANRPKSSGKVTGKLTATTAEERRAKAKQIRAQERARQRELKRQERLKKRMLSASARTRRSRRTGRKGGETYVLKAVVATGSENYALVDSRKVQVGDFVLGRKIVGISPDRIEIEAFGKRSTVRVGESLMPQASAPTTSR